MSGYFQILSSRENAIEILPGGHFLRWARENGFMNAMAADA